MKTYLSLKVILILILTTAFWGCSTSRVVQPVDKHSHQAGINFGGPLILFEDTPMPIPLTAMNYAYGATDNFTLFGGLHLTSAAYGLLQIDMGGLYQLFEQRGYLPGLSSSLSLNVLKDVREANSRVFPQLDFNAYWSYHNRGHFLYTGLGSWFELQSHRAHNEQQLHHIVPSIHLGHTWKTMKWNYTVELKYLAPNISNQDIVIDYITPFDVGTLGLYANFSRRF